MSELLSCEYCGGEDYDASELKLGKCMICIVNDCLHKEIIREYEGSNHWRARFTIHCIHCNAFREMRFYFPQAKTNTGHSMTLEDWDHEEINQGDIYQ